MIPSTSAVLLEHPLWHLLDHVVADLLLVIVAVLERLDLALWMALLDRDVLTVMNLNQFAADAVTMLLADLLLLGVAVLLVVNDLALLMTHLLVLGLADRPKTGKPC